MARNQTQNHEIEILNFIFHVVHHGEETPILLNNTPIIGFESFFKERIKEIINGNQFIFLEDSQLLEKIREIEGNIQRFVNVSKDLATTFHQQHQDARIKPGVMILIKALVNNSVKYILIKYDNENVITYIRRGNEAVLEEISNTFSRNRSALQKSAVIDIYNEIPYALILDKSEPRTITQFFKGFLGVARKYSDKALTDKLKNAFIVTIKKHKDSLPKEILSDAGNIYYNFVQQNESFNRESFLSNILGRNYLPNLERDFEKELKNQDLLDSEFIFDRSIRQPVKRKFYTIEGVKIEYTSDAADKVSITHQEDETIITITTSQLIEDKC